LTTEGSRNDARSSLERTDLGPRRPSPAAIQPGGEIERLRLAFRTPALQPRM
jgi:hypothetical protein